MRTKARFDEALRRIADPAERVAAFGALLARDSGLGAKLVLAGGSAIQIYSEGRYYTEDVDVVGEKRRIVPLLKRWGFTPVDDPDGRVYWRRDDLSLAVDILPRAGGSGSGRSAPTQTITTPVGPVEASAVEDLIVRRLVFWSRGGRRELLDQAVGLFLLRRDAIDLGYLRAEVRYEKVEAAYRELRRLADASDPRRR
jgi:hypothetical protein